MKQVMGVMENYTIASNRSDHYYVTYDEIASFKNVVCAASGSWGYSFTLNQDGTVSKNGDINNQFDFSNWPKLQTK